MERINPAVRWWMAPKFPEAHIRRVLRYEPPGFINLIRDRFRTWVVHPVKRRIAKYYLSFLKGFCCLKVIALTGSAGKTTTKEMIASILRQNWETVSSFQNIDPVFNIPTTILACRPSTRYLVLEMGVEIPGEIDFYLWLAKPDIAVITNIYPTHTLFFKNVDGVFREKRKLAKGLGKDGVAIFNFEDSYLKGLGENVRVKVLWFNREDDTCAEKITITKDLKTKFTLISKLGRKIILLSSLGNQYVENALAAASCALALGFRLGEIKKGLEFYPVPDHRMKVIKHRSGAIILDDSYNNNPEAAIASLETFRKVAGRKKKVVVFGDMLELGDLDKTEHRRLGKIIGEMNVDYLVGVGPASMLVVGEAQKILGKKRALWSESSTGAQPLVEPFLKKNTVILIKGSRAIGLDKLVDTIANYATKQKTV